ncbi:MAG TPA: hypothetical protein VLE53_14250 [Gemmatimonadaceae bacterium]|nr:hypothetical protein [Gemmatimonadaceae bacterium]
MTVREPPSPRASAAASSSPVAQGAFSRSAQLDVHAYVGPYPWRQVPHADANVLIRVLEREGVHRAWVGYLPSAFHRDPNPGNTALYGTLAPHRDTLFPAPVVRPDWPGWPRELARAIEEGAAAIRAYPMHWGFPAGSSALTELGAACSERRLPLLLTVRFEDARQRHPHDVTGDLTAAHIRALARARTAARVVILGAGRGLIEEVHWSLTPEERAWVWWDISWIWGPPEDDLAHLLRAVGPDRFVYGAAWPLRLAQTPRANLALLPEDVATVSLADPWSW